MAEFSKEELEIIRARREKLAPVYGAEIANISDADILSFTEDQIADSLKKEEPPLTKADIKALFDVIERQGKALDDFAKRIAAQDQNIAMMNSNVEQVAQAVSPLIKTFNDFAPKSNDGGNGNGNGKALVAAGGGNGGGKMDIMGLLQNPLVQKMFLGGGEQQNPMEYFINQVTQVTTLLSKLDEVRGGANRSAVIKPGNIDMSTLLKGMQWGYRIKNGQLPPGLLQALGGDDSAADLPPNIIVVQQPAEVKQRRDPDEHKI